MPQVYFRQFRTRGVYASYPAFRRVLSNEFQSRIGPDIIKLHDLTTVDWKRRPEFKATMKVDQSGISVRVFPEENDPVAKIWYSLNKGVPGRVIRPNPSRRRVRITARKRKLGRKYRRNTKVIGRLRRPMALRFKGASGEDVYRSVIYNWPGIRARRYTFKIAREYNPVFIRLMENAMRRAVRAAQREGS